ncbi:MAG: MBL fold metallo-hydrolase [Patescibacteria group bacterium]
MSKLTKTLLFLFLPVAVLIWVEIAKSPTADSRKDPAVYFLDVGQGDAQLIQNGNYQILIDGGPDDKILPELGKYMPVGDREIEIVILSHPHADHLVGLNQVIDRYQIGRIYTNGVLYDSNQYEEFIDKIKDKKIETVIPKIGESIIPFTNSALTFLWPGEKYKDQIIKNLNNSSEVVKFCYLLKCVLFTGDLEEDEQANMFTFYSSSAGDNFKADILKVPHHGSSTGLSDDLYNFVAPTAAIISAGIDNRYAHPHKQVIDYLSSKNIEIRRTDLEGTIVTGLGQ